MERTLITSEKTYLTLRTLYEKCGYKKFAMRKFEEYSLYVENKNFLTSEYILTFNDPHGRLMALKPDVTLSILKNSAGGSGSEKTYYRESVYRMDKQSMEYREIEQLGVEMIDCSDVVSLTELCALASDSLTAVDPDSILCISDMGFVMGMLGTLKDATERQKRDIIAYINAGNPHELRPALESAGADSAYAEMFSSLIAFSGDSGETLCMADKVVLCSEMSEALERLRAIISALSDRKNLRIDMTLTNDSSYYNGLVFRGYVSRIPRSVLSGGCYDKLALKFGKKKGAAGFALYLSELNAYYDEKPEYDADVLLIYRECGDLNRVLSKAAELRNSSKSVRVERKIPAGMRFREIIEII